jgi:hypothetical protein
VITKQSKDSDMLNSSILSRFHNLTYVVVSIKDGFENYLKDKKKYVESFFRSISKVLGVPVEKIRLVSVNEGSIEL